MPYVPTTPTLLLCSQLATYVNTLWAPVLPNAVDWDFFRRYGDKGDFSAATLVGQQVIFFPTVEEYSWETNNREYNRYHHRVSCLTVERYTGGAGDSPRDWSAALTDFVHTYIVAGLRFTQTGPAPFNPLLCSKLDGEHKVQICDIEKLVQKNKLFYALVDLEFWEDVPHP